MRFVIYGVSTPHASELVETTRRLGWDVAAAVRNRPEFVIPDDLGEVVDVDQLWASLRELPFAVPQTNPAQRRAAVEDARANGFHAGATLVDPTAVLPASLRIGEGVYVGAGSVIGAGAELGDWCLVNRSCSIAHHVRLGEYVSMGPGVVIAGSCRIEPGAFIGAGATLAPELLIGAGAIVGAGAVVIRHVADGDVVVGNPARVLRSGAGHS